MSKLLTGAGVFALWSDHPPEPRFMDVLGAAFEQTRAEVVSFANPLTGGRSRSTVYLARAQASTADSSEPTRPGKSVSRRRTAAPR
jgi:hypothetical protein